MRIDAIRDKVAIVGMGCTKFGEHWDMSVDDMVIEASFEALQDSGVELKDIEAAWVGTAVSGGSGMLLSTPLKTRNLPITRVENGCGTGMEALRNATFGVACGLYDLVLVVGVEKLKDSGLSGLPEFMTSLYAQGHTAPGRWALGATRYFQAYEVPPEDGKRLLAKIAVKNHYNGTLSPKAHFRKEISLEQAINAPVVAWPLGLFDCCPTTDGAAAAVICSTEIAKNFRDDYVLIKGFGVAMSAGLGKEDIDYHYNELPETEAAANQAYAMAGITNPRQEIDLAAVHDCFTIAELMEYEAIGFSPKGRAKDDIESGAFTLEGDLPVNTDGGLKSFGHPIGATGLRMCYEAYTQIQGKAGPRQVKDPKLAYCMAQFGHPGYLGPFATILGRRD